jgi:YidC/Oxa1 family membrane protein insertase
LKKCFDSRTIAIMSSLFNTFFYEPLYNGLIFLMDLLPWFDAGVIVILFTILIKFLLFPLSKKASLTQMAMKEIEPDLEKIRTTHKDNREEVARKTMELYRQKKVNPFSTILVVLIQLPIIFALYFVFLRSGLPILNEGLLYSFIPHPESIDMNFLGLFDITQKSVVLAFLAGISSFIQMRIAAPAMPAPKKDGSKATFRDELARSMSIQMRYIFPIIVFFISFTISGVVALYWFTSNVFTIFQELALKKMREKKNVEILAA